MEMLWVLTSVRDAAVLEYGCQGHALYAQSFMARAGQEQEAHRLFSTHLDEQDIIFGHTDRLFAAAHELADKGDVRAIFLLPSTVPMITGMNLAAAAASLQAQLSDVGVLAFNAGGFDTQPGFGVAQALLGLARGLALSLETIGSAKTRPDTEATFNLIGAYTEAFGTTPDTTGLIADLHERFALHPLNILTDDCSVTSLGHLGEAQINLVLCDEALPTARYLHERFQTPYLSCSPTSPNFASLYKILERKERS
jgi:nitrogenase molybdenum-iron protein alpha/beta subunit